MTVDEGNILSQMKETWMQIVHVQHGDSTVRLGAYPASEFNFLPIQCMASISEVFLWPDIASDALANMFMS